MGYSVLLQRNEALMFDHYFGTVTMQKKMLADTQARSNNILRATILSGKSVTCIIGASVSEPLSSDLNVNFVCLSVCLSWMDRQLTVNHFRLLFCALCVMH